MFCGDKKSSDKNKTGKIVLVIVLGLVILAILGIGIWFLIICMQKDSENEGIIDSEVYETGMEVDESSDVAEINDQKVFQDKLSELMETYGVFAASQYGVMHTPDDTWMNPNGIMSATVLDFDSDGADEMLVCYTELAEDVNYYSHDYYKIVMSMYEEMDGEAVLADQVPFSTYCDWQYGVVDDVARLSYCKSDDEALSLHSVQVDGNIYIMCEEYLLGRNFADGMYRAYWMMEYVDGNLEYVCSYAQLGVGSAEFQYAGYDFSDGTLVESNLYYCEGWYEGIEQWDEDIPLYDDYTLAITNFFKKYGIELNTSALKDYDVTMGSILSDTNEKTKIFEFVNKTMNADYENSTFEYQALLSVGENDILERSDDNEGDDALEAVSGTSGGYILPESNSRYLSKSELEGLSAEECRLARNEIYARYGRKFDDEVLQSYFNSCDWYIPTIEAGDFQESMLNDYEVANRDLIVEYEQEQSYR